MSTDHPTITDASELQRRLLVAIIVAGKNADFAYRATDALLADCPVAVTPFIYLRGIYVRGGVVGLQRLCERSRTGNYGKMVRAIATLVASKLDLTRCTPADLEQVPGIGPKTSRFFILWTRPRYRCAALDVHVLRWLRAQGHDAPKSTPQSRKVYARLEAAFLAEADKRGLGPRELDHQIWAAANIGGIDRQETNHRQEKL